MRWDQIVNEVLLFLEAIKDANAETDFESDSTTAQYWLNVGGSRFTVFISTED